MWVGHCAFGVRGERESDMCAPIVFFYGIHVLSIEHSMEPAAARLLAALYTLGPRSPTPIIRIHRLYEYIDVQLSHRKGSDSIVKRTTTCAHSITPRAPAASDLRTARGDHLLHAITHCPPRSRRPASTPLRGRYLRPAQCRASPRPPPARPRPRGGRQIPRPPLRRGRSRCRAPR